MEINHPTPSLVTDEDLRKHFTGYDGCFVLYDQGKGEYLLHNPSQARQRVSPCSTFKIPHALIGLESGVLTGADHRFPWDGTEYPIAAWNQDQTLRSAVANSAVWCFRQLAARIGSGRMPDYLDRFNYGNRDISGGLTQFWLQSSLLISPREQVDWLQRFYHYRLPAARRNIDIVKDIITSSYAGGSRLAGKTGSGGSPSLGWFVGYAEKGDSVGFFATRIVPGGPAEGIAWGKETRAITLRILQEQGWL